MNRRYVALAVVLLVIVAGAWALQSVLFPKGAKALEVVSVKGDVSVQGPEGESDLVAGAKIAPGQSVRTLAGEATLRGEGSATVTLTEGSKVTVGGVIDGIARLSLDEGRVIGFAKEGEGSGIEVTGGRDRASVSTRGGKFAAAVDGAGDLAVATLEGTAKVVNGDITKDLTAGQQAILGGGKVEVGAIPTAVLLKVDWPGGGKTREKTTTVVVAAPRGANVRVNGKKVALKPRADGQLEGTVEVELDEGPNKLQVKAEDVAGNAKEEFSDLIELDTRPPPIKSGTAKWN